MIPIIVFLNNTPPRVILIIHQFWFKKCFQIRSITLQY